MSQAGIVSFTGAVIPSNIPITFQTQIDSPAVSNANILIVSGGDTLSNSDNGIQSDGSSGGNTLTIQLTNRETGTITTPAAALTTIISLSLGATPGTFFVYGNVQAFNASTPAGASYGFSGAFRTTGIAATEIATEYHDEFEEAALATADIFLSASANNILVQVQGVGGLSINWNALLEYRQVN